MSSSFRISVGVNIVLLGLIIALLWRERTVNASAPALPSRRAAAPSKASDRDGLANDLKPNPGGPELTPAAVAELERRGISADAIANALIDDHTYRYDKRVRAVQKKYAPKPVPRREMLELSRAADAERIRELKQALGDEGYVAWDKETTLRQLNMGGLRLDAPEAEKAYRLQREFRDKNKALEIAKEDGITDEADTDALYVQAQRQLDQELEKLFGKDRLAAIRGAPDPIADVGRRFQDLEPTLEQAKAVLQSEGDAHAREAALVQRLKDNPENAANLMAELKAITDAREQNLRQIFGPENYDRAKRASDATYQKLTQYAEAWNLDAPRIQPVYEALRAFHDQADRTRMAAEMSEAAGHTVNWHEINSGIQQAQGQLEAALANAIGGERVRRLKQNGLLDVR